jgi:hypothetical protein
MYEKRYAGYQPPPQVKDLPGRDADERRARLMHLIAQFAPAVGGAVGAGIGAFGGPGGVAAGFGTGAGLGQLAGAGLNYAGTDTMMPHAERDLQRQSRRDRLLAIASGM